MKKAVIFDMDGVLFDTEKLSMDSFEAATKESSIPLGYEQALSFIGMNNQDFHAALIEILQKQEYVDTYLELCSKAYWNSIRTKGIPIKNGAKEALQYCKDSDFLLALATSSDAQATAEKLNSAKFTDYFDVIITGDLFKHGKPAPDIYLKACEDLNIQPYQAYAVEDSHNGIISAHTAGLDVIMVPDLLPPNADIAPLCFRIIDSLNDLRNII